mgnify:CR=1 FL=1
MGTISSLRFCLFLHPRELSAIFVKNTEFKHSQVLQYINETVLLFC